MPAVRPALLLLALAALAPATVRAQAPLSLVNDRTTVSSISFDGLGPLLEDNVREVIATTEPQVSVIGKITGFAASLLGRGDENVYPFSPVELAKDAVRVRRYYAESGFPRASVGYDVQLDTSDNAVDVTFLIERGPPLVLDEVTFAGPGQTPVTAQLPPSLHDDWEDYTQSIRLRSGTRLDQSSLADLQRQTTSWFANRGYAFAYAGAERFADSTGLRADVRVKVDAGPRARIGDVRLEPIGGPLSVSDRVVLRELPFQPGDLYDASELIEGQRQIFGLGLFQLALVNLAEGQPRDSTVDVVVQVRQGDVRSVTGYAGYATEGGVTGRGQFTHRNFFGGARTLTPALVWRTGLGGETVGANPATAISDFQATLTLQQPYVFDRRLSATVSGLYRRRNDRIERSNQVEASTALLFTRNTLQTASLTATVNSRTLLNSRVNGLGLLSEDVLVSDSTSLMSRVASLELGGTYGVVDDPLAPRRGFVLRPSAAVAGGPVGGLSFGRGRLTATALYPFNDRVGLVARATGGVLAPYSGTDIGGIRDYLLLRDRLFYAGGTNDVRGWGEGLLGPKVFDFDLARIDSAEIAATYTGVGGRGKASASVQLNLPLPVGPQWGANVFVDAGRVFAPAGALDGLFTPAAFYDPGEPVPSGVPGALDDVLALYRDEGGVRVGAGAGLQYLTPVGFVSVALGVKLNPSYFDRRPAESGPALLLAAGLAGLSPDDLDTDAGLAEAQRVFDQNGFTNASDEPFDVEEALSPSFFSRLQFHLSLGQTF
ncbi:BamA/OMP85 family outer membrane protein [Rubrivirga litoralis]|uniref:BamA/TamA family outer membrane protein n=1 Tax=Rubrivirga litoralis TaxID=3075598 RepID=A0ABU3BR70_9BACT|nr:BamA/TamA family outer membrane protein [Rubrivirga sp. F394]MDT0631780.1 BamA/TamA family outer membrane protein [Rubrivirga sp. F394]